MTCVLTLVHGTWSPNAPWVQSESPFSEYMEKRVDGLVAATRLNWTGSNTLTGRFQAAGWLRSRIDTVEKEYPTARHFIIAHSHGGNIAMYALRDPEIEKKVAGVICLGTPFLFPRPREFGPFGWTCISRGAGALFLVVGGLVSLTVYIPGPEALVLLARGAFIALVTIVGVKRVQEWIRDAERMRKRLAMPDLKHSQVFVVRAPGDEASGGLAGLRTAGTVLGLGWRRLAVPGGALVRLAARLRHRTARRWRLLRLPITVATICLGGIGGAYLTVAGLILGLLGSLASGILRFVGKELAPFGLFLDVTIEASPPGTWLVYQLGTPTTESPEDSLIGRGLDHSSIYTDPRALAAIADWINLSPAWPN